MIGAVDIANAALLKLGDKTITSLDDDNKAARLAKLRYPSARQAVLRMHSWKFAKTRLTLAPSSTPPASGWSYYLPFPANYIRLV